jgi:hypothetical protein
MIMSKAAKAKREKKKGNEQSTSKVKGVELISILICDGGGVGID